MNNRDKKIIGIIALFLTALIWGFAFSAQSVAIHKVGVFSLQTTRCILAAAFLAVFIVLLCKEGKIVNPLKKENIIGGIVCGAVLFIASNTQQFGIKYTSVSKSSFLATLYIFIVPLAGYFVGRPPKKKIWVCVAMALAGMLLLCDVKEADMNKGDIYVILSAFFFALHIFVIDKYVPKGDGVVISCIQMITCALLSLPFMLLIEKPSVPSLLDAWLPIAYAGIMSCGIAYSLQVMFQSYLSPSNAALILSLESVFGAIGGWLLLGEKLSISQIIGCMLMFGAIVIANYEPKKGEDKCRK